MTVIYRISLLWFLTFLIVSRILGQSAMIDSLIKLYPTIENEERRIDMINKIGFLYYTSDIEKTLEYAQLGLKRSEKISYAEGKGTALNTMSIYYEVSGDVEKALALNKEVLQIGERTQNDFLISISCNNIANKYDTKGEPQKAISYYQRAISISEKTNDSRELMLGYANLAVLHGNLNDNEIANLYYQKAKVLLDQYPDAAMYCWFYGVLGRWHFDNGNFEEAKRCYKIGLDESKKRNDKRAIVTLNLDLSKLHLALKLTERAEQSIQTAINTAQLIGDRILTLNTKIGLLDLLFETKQLNKAYSLGKSLLDTAQEYKFTAEEMKIYDVLSKVQLEKEDYKNGYILNQEYLRLKDSLLSETKGIEVAKIEEKYQSKLKEKENVLLRAQKKEQSILLSSQRKLGMALVAIIFLISLLGLLIFLAYKSQKNRKEELEEKVIDRTKELEQSNTELIKSNNELERFAYIASHDLKEPLRNISGFTKLLQLELKNNLSSSAKEYISFITKGTKQMHTLIEDVLEYSKLTKTAEELTIVDFNIILSQIKESLTYTLEEKQANLIIESKLPKMMTPKSKVHFLFKNLIENGLKFNQSAIPEVNVGCKNLDNQLTFYISDNGIGIDKNYKDKIFEMFNRLHSRKDYEGSGLGLSICKKIVEEQGGKIWLDTKNESGSTFYFTLGNTLHGQNSYSESIESSSVLVNY